MLASLDPNASVRKLLSAELRDFESLLDSSPVREELHVFLENHPHFLCPNRIRMWSKLAFGDKVSDFVFREAAGDYLLVEIERSTHSLFTKSGDATSVLNHACSQVADWKMYIQHHHSTVEKQLELTGISTSPRSLVVIGRSNSLTAKNREKLRALESETPTRKILTYDDVYLNAKAVIENMFGPLDFSGPATLMSYTSKPLPVLHPGQATLTF